MRQFLLLVALSLPALQVVSQGNNGVLEGRVVRPGTSEGIPDVQIMLIGPSPEVTTSTLSGLYTPNPALTPAMREEIDALISSAPPGLTAEAVAAAAIRTEARLLGLPPPTTPLASTRPRQTGALTDRDGRFSFRTLAPGRYEVRAQREGYFGTPPPGSNAIFSPLVSTPAIVAVGRPTSPALFEMLRGATVSGRVRDPNGQPMVGVSVTAFQVNYREGRKLLSSVNARTTDDRGEYRLYWIPPGDYIIGATPRPPSSAAQASQRTYARTFYPNVVDARSAPAVSAAEGVELNGIDLVIRPAATGTISGQVATSVIGPNGQPGIASTFYLITADPSTLTDSVTSALANSSPNRTGGDFELRGILPGQYDLAANIQDGAGRAVWGRTRVNVGAGELRDVVLDIHPGVETKVRLAIDGAVPSYTMQPPQDAPRGGTIVTATQQLPTAPVATPTYRVQLRFAEALPYSPPFESAANQGMTYDPSGVFVFPNVLEGKYGISVSPLPRNGYIADVRVGGTSVFDSGVVDINSQTAEIQVFVNSNGVRIQGSVVDSIKKPIPSARVALVPSQSRRQNIQLFQTAVTDASGNFTIDSAVPGDYTLFAWQSAPPSAWTNAEFLGPFEGKGLPISLRAGVNPAAIEVPIIPIKNLNRR